MSRGPGRLQRAIFSILRHNLKPMTFTEIMGPPPEHGCGFHPYFIRSVRRALRRMVDDGDVMAIGAGGPRDPHRYCVHPFVVALFGERAEYDALVAAIEDAEQQCRKARSPDRWANLPSALAELGQQGE